MEHVVHMNTKDKYQNETLEMAKRKLQLAGWSQRQAATHLGYSLTHFNQVLTGRRIFSQTLVNKIMAIPECPNPRKHYQRKKKMAVTK